MVEIHAWLTKKLTQQTLEAVFRDAWYSTFGASCASNKVQMDAREYATRHTIPSYVASFYRKERTT